MNINISAWSIRNPVPSILLFLVLMLLGTIAFKGLPITRFPNIDVPVIAVSVGQQGAAPAELESQVTKRVEDAISSITGVNHIVSTLTDGSSTTAVEFRMEVPTDQALQDVKDAIAKVRGDLPRDVDEPVIQKIDVEGQSIQTYAVSAPAMTLEELSWFVDDVVKRQLQGTSGVGRVERYGGVNREIQVNLDPGKLQALGVTAGDINRQLAATNTDLGGGRGEVGGREQAIRTLGGAKTIEELSNITLSLSGGRQVRLNEVGSIVDSYEEPRSFARYEGKPVVTFSVFRAKGASAVAVGERVEKIINKLRTEYPNVKYDLVDDTVFYINGNYKAAMETLIEGALLAILVVMIFLRDWRATLISAVALPLSAIPAFWAMSLMGFSLNLVSFLGITLATGILVDDAIVEIENIVRHMKMGKSAYRASLEAADEIGLAVIAITFTIVAVFVPVSFMEGIPGQYFRQFGLTVAAAVLFSLLVARLITPMMAAYLMRSHSAVEHHPGVMARGYSNLIRFSNYGVTYAKTNERKSVKPQHVLGAALLTALLAFASGAGVVPAIVMTVWYAALGLALVAILVHFLMGYKKNWTFARRAEKLVGANGETLKPQGRFRFMSYLTIVAAFGILFGSTALIPLLPTGFIPPGDESRFVLSVQLPPGSVLKDTLAKTDELAAIIAKHPEVETVFVLGGSSPTGGVEPRNASVFANLKKKSPELLPNLFNPIISGVNNVTGLGIPLFHNDGRTKPQWDVENEIMPELQNITDLRMWKVNDRGTRDVAFNLLSADPEALAKAVSQLESKLRQEPGLRLVAAEGALNRPEIKIKPKLEEAARLGINAQQISEAVRIATIGDFGAALAKFSAGDRLIPIRVQIPREARSDLREITGLKITTSSGQSIPITAVADITFGEGPSSVTRFDRKRQAVIGADLQAGFALGDAQERFKKVAEELKLPSSVSFQEAGDAEIQNEIFSSFGKAAGLGVVIMFGILVLLLGNFFQPLAIVLSLPLSIGGVVLALLWTNNSLSMPVVIGMLMLMGIVAKNAIMLIDFAVERVKHGMERGDAIVEAGRMRARPIVMTTIAMGAGMLPSALGIGEGGEFRAPMAIAVIGGLIASTFLSLVFVPSFYIVMDDMAKFTSWLFGWMVGPEDEPKEANPVNALEERVEDLEHRLADKKPKLALAAE